MRFEIFWHANEGRYTVSIPNYPGGVVETVEQVQGGIPHGFGLYIDGKFVRVDIGGLGKVITDLQEWKTSALKSMLKVDTHRIAEQLGVEVGTDITTKVILDPILDLQIENGYLHQALVQAKNDLINVAHSLGAPTSPFGEDIQAQRKIMNDQARYAGLAAKDINVE